MVFDAPNPEEVVKEYGIAVYKKVWGSLESQLSISMPQTFRLGAFLESLSLIHDRAVEILQKLCTDVAVDRSWTDKGLCTTNLSVVDLEAQWQVKLSMELEQIGWAEGAVKDLQVALGDANFTQKYHEYELSSFFDKLSIYQEGVLQNIRTMTERVDKIEAYTLTGFIDQGSIQLEALMNQISELEKDRISDRLRIDGFESSLNAGADELAIGRVIICSPEDLKSHIVSVQGESRNFGGLICVYNIFTRVHQCNKGGEMMVEVTKHKNDLARLKMLENEAITVFTILVAVTILSEGKRTTKSDIAYLPTYGRWIDNILHTGLGYYL